MPNIASVLKQEISRVARKELRAQTDSLKKTVTALRSEVSALKRRMQEFEGQQRKAARAKPSPTPTAAEPADGKVVRFSAKGLASNRRRLGLSAADLGMLVGASGQSVYLWENGKTQPRAKQLPAIAALRGIGKREAAQRLVALRERA